MGFFFTLASADRGNDSMSVSDTHERLSFVLVVDFGMFTLSVAQLRHHSVLETLVAPHVPASHYMEDSGLL